MAVALVLPPATQAITIIDLQPQRETAQMAYATDGHSAQATLVNLNPGINAWYVLTLEAEGEPAQSFHLELSDPAGPSLRLEAPDGIAIGDKAEHCALWSGEPSVLETAHRSVLPYVPVCGQQLLVRNSIQGRYTHVESVTNFLRDHVWGGDRIVGFFKREFFHDAWIEKVDISATVDAPDEEAVAGAPAAAQLTADAPRRAALPVRPLELPLIDAAGHEQGTVFSHLQPGLATLYILDDGTVGMKTWSEADDAMLPHVLHARQNGVPLLEPDAPGERSRPGALVTQWGSGNWSGSKDEKQRTLRAGACLLQNSQRSFLVYGYFSTATPSAMARVFQSYGCLYAMHLDMNALEHTYLAVYTPTAQGIGIRHLIEGMDAVDRKGGEELAPRFLSAPDNRDFFYLLRKDPRP